MFTARMKIIMDKKRSVVIVGILILLVLPLAYAGDYDAGDYDTGKYGVGEVPAVTTPPSGGGTTGGSSGSTTTPTYECTEDSDCNETQYCFEHICYDAECSDNSACNVETGETCWHGRCVKLFDVEIKDFQSPVKLGEFFEFTYLLKGMADISDDVEIHFWIEKDEEVITSGHDTIYLGNFEEKTKTTKLFLPSDIVSGEYIFSVQLIYGTYQAKSHRTIEIGVEGGLATIGLSPKLKGITNYIISALIGIGAFVLFFIFYLERRKVKKALMPEVKWIKKYRITLLISLLFVVLGALIYYLKWYEIIADWSLSVASWISPYLISYGYYMLGGVVLVVALIIFIIVARKKHLVERFREWSKEKVRERKAEAVKYQIVERKEKIRNKEKMKEFFTRHKISLSIILLIVILAGVVSYLFYAGILTVGQLENLWDGVANSLNKVGGWFKVVGNSIVDGLRMGYNATADWIIGNWLYLTMATGIVILGFILYFTRKQLSQVGNWIGRKVKEHKVGFVIWLGVVVLIGIIVYLFYSEILTIDGLGNLLDGFVNWIKGF